MAEDCVGRLQSKVQNFFGAPGVQCKMAQDYAGAPWEVVHCVGPLWNLCETAQEFVGALLKVMSNFAGSLWEVIEDLAEAPCFQGKMVQAI